MYLHAPDRATSFAETLATINEEYKKGRFARFGLSNYKAEEVEEIVKVFYFLSSFLRSPLPSALFLFSLPLLPLH